MGLVDSLNSINKAMLAIAETERAAGNLEAAQSICSTLLKDNPGDEDATMMIAQITCQQKSFTSTTFHLKQLLDKKPTHWRALALYIDMVKRCGRLSSGDVEKQFERVERTLDSPSAVKSTQSIDSAGENSSRKLNLSSEHIQGKATMQSGYHFCRGLNYR